MTTEVPPKKHGRRFTPEQIEAALHDYRTDTTTPTFEIARKHGMTPSTLYAHRRKSDHLYEVHYLQGQVMQLKEKISNFDVVLRHMATMQRQLDELTMLYAGRR